MENDYKKQLNIEKKEKIRGILRELPSFCSGFFISIQNDSSVLTQLNYAYDIKLFFKYLSENHTAFSGNIRSLPPSRLNEVALDDLYGFLDYVSLYKNDNDMDVENGEHGKARKIACLRSFFKYYYKLQILDKNICELLDTPKIHEKPIVRLEPNEIADLLDAVESGSTLTASQKKYHKKTVLRDLALFTLFLSTGIRVSELVALNISDIYFDNNAFKVTRKGGDQVILYFGDETKKALADYISARKVSSDFSAESPLFISLQGKRLNVRSVENIVKKYTMGAVPLKHISPHKLRSTFGTALYNETEDIYMVADVLGHKDVNTTRRHYAAVSDDIRRRASKAVKLRD